MRRLLIGVLVALPLTVGWDTVAWPQAHYQGCHVNTSTAVVCRAGAGTLYAVTINAKGASGNYTYIFNASSFSFGGTPILVIDTTAGPLTLQYNIQMSTGITVWSTSGTIADLTVVTD